MLLVMGNGLGLRVLLVMGNGLGLECCWLWVMGLYH